MAGSDGARRAASRGRGLGARVALVLVFALVGLWPAVADAQAAAGTVTLYADLNYTGNSLTMSGDIANLSSFNFNDITTSLRVSTGTRVAAFADANYLGACEEFAASDGDLRNNRIGDDRISSLLLNQRCPVQLFADLSYGGASRNVRGDIPDLRTLGFDNAATSLFVPAGLRVAAFSDANYGGICEEFTAGDGDLRDNPSGNDRISSVQLGKACPPGVTLFADRNYGGDYHIVVFGSSGVDDLEGFRRVASSIHVTGMNAAGYAVVRISMYETKLVCTMFKVSDPDLSDDAVGNDGIDSMHFSYYGGGTCATQVLAP